MKLTVQITGMHCEACIEAIRAAVESLPTVEVATIELGRVDLIYNEASIDKPTLFAAIRRAGDFDVVGFTRTD